MNPILENQNEQARWSSGALVSHLPILEKVRHAQTHFDCLAAGELGAECRSAAADGLLKSIGYVTVCDADGFHTDDEDEGFVLTDAGLAVLRAEDQRRAEAFRASLANIRDEPRAKRVGSGPWLGASGASTTQDAEPTQQANDHP